MADITAKDIQGLRQRAGVGMMDAKKALTDADGDIEQAMELLRERGLAQAVRRAGREATEGTIGTYVHVQNEHPVMGVLVELACETDFVAKSPEFNDAANDIALHISWADPAWITDDDVDQSVIDKEEDLIEREARVAGKPDAAIPRIVEGRIDKFLEEKVLYRQQFVNKEKFDGTIGDLVAGLAARMGENVHVRKISRIAVGE